MRSGQCHIVSERVIRSFHSISNMKTKQIQTVQPFSIIVDTCETPPIMTSIMKHCRSDYGWINDDTSDYLPSWQKPSDSDGNSTQIEEDLKNAETPWVYQNSLQLKGVPYLGTINTYKGGGYVDNFILISRISSLT